MVVGHIGFAELLLDLNKTIPALPVIIGVNYPDLIWPLLVLTKKEEVKVDPSTPLGSATRFTKFPYSHSLVLSGLLTLIPAALFALGYHRWIVGAFFFMAALSHWLLDSIVHLGDLPVLGFGKDKKVGLGLWKYGKTSFWVEYGFVIACTLLFTPRHLWLPLLIAATAFQALNANSFFGFTKKNTVKDATAMVSSALFGLPLIIIVFNLILTHR